MQKNLSVFIVDDEGLARDELKELLSEYKFIKVIGEADNVDSAILKINTLKPDVVFLDIQMPGKTGFDLVNQIEIDSEIVFVTAYDEFAIRAFEINALDYLMKPIYPNRLKQTIERLSEKSTVVNNKTGEKLQNDDFIFLALRHISKFIKVSSIIAITSSKEYTEIVTIDGSKGLIYKSMTEWERRLPEKNFLRIHRKAIINLHHVLQLKPSLNKTYKVFMKGLKEPLDMSRRYASKLKKLMV